MLAFMCASMGLDPDTALEVLRIDIPEAAPNAGFAAQLRLFVAMGCEVDEDDEGYKRFRLQQRSVAFEAEGVGGAASDFAAPPVDEGDGGKVCHFLVGRARPPDSCYCLL